MATHIRNVAIIAHIDHGKTTLVDKLLSASKALNRNQQKKERIMDSGALEKERGITITAKNCGFTWKGCQINIVDTPGHADFGGEVERILSMVDSVILLLDAVDGPMQQTRFVTRKAFSYGLKPLVLVNKCDRQGARPDWVIDKVFDLFAELGASEEQLDFSSLFLSAIHGICGDDWQNLDRGMDYILDYIVENLPAPKVEVEGNLQLQISSLDYNSYIGLIGLGRIHRGSLKLGQEVSVVSPEGDFRPGKISALFDFHGLEKRKIQEASAGAIVSLAGIPDLRISETLSSKSFEEPLKALRVDEPTVQVGLLANDSPFSSKEGKLVTARQIWDRLQFEAQYNVALRISKQQDSQEKFIVCGRGELHLGILIETMRREGFELGISRPEVLLKKEQDQVLEPYEDVSLIVEETYQGSLVQELGLRGAELKDMVYEDSGQIRLEYVVATRALIGFSSLFIHLTAGTGLLSHAFSHYGPYLQKELASRKNGVLVSMVSGTATAYSLFNLKDRGTMFVEPGDEVYEGMIIGIHSRENDLVVNPVKEKQLTNFRAAMKDDNLLLPPAKKLSLEEAMEFIQEDELLEVTPESLRLRKKYLKDHERKRAR